MRRLYNRFENWANVSVYKPGPGLPIDIRRIDIILACAFVFCVGYYYLTAGWYTAVIGGLTFIMMAMVALWMF